MGKQKKPIIRFLYLLIGIHILAFTLFSCSVEESITKNKISERDIKIKNLTYSEFNQKTFNVKNRPNLEGMISENAYARTAEDSSKYEIYTDKIIEASKDDYTSYTMFLKAPTSTEKVYYNIVFKIKDEITEVFILKYTKTESGIVEEVITTFKSREGILGGGKNVLQVIDQFDGSGGGGDIGGSIGTPTSTNPGGMSWTGLGGSPIYPQNCNGTVTNTYVMEPHMCSENKHWPPSQCNAAQWAYYELVPYYSCVPNPSSGTTNPPTSGGGNTGGGGTTTPPEDEEDITVMIQPIDCNEHIPGDLNGDCQLSPYETCLLSGNSQEVCDCVAAGGNIADCQDENDCENLANLLGSNKTNLNDYISQLETKHNANIDKEHAYVFKKEIQYSDPITDEVTYNYLPATEFVGTATSIAIVTDTKTYADIHLHTKGHGAASGLFSWGDIYNFGKFYSGLSNAQPAATFKEKNDISTMVFAPDPLNENNYNVYALTVKDATQLNSATQNEWNSSKWSNITNVKDRMDKINNAYGDEYVKNKTRLERFFLDTFNSYGITLYKLENNQWKELTPDTSNNNGVTKNPCE